jgi:hypothetical protein
MAVWSAIRFRALRLASAGREALFSLRGVKPNLSLIFAGMQGIGSVGTLALAMYGLFGTNIPEALVSLLNSDLREIRGKVDALTGKRDVLEAENRSLARQQAQAESEANSARAAAEQLTDAKVRAENALALASSELASVHAELDKDKASLTSQEEKIRSGKQQIAELKKIRAKYTSEMVHRPFAVLLMREEAGRFTPALRQAAESCDLFVKMYPLRPDLAMVDYNNALSSVKKVRPLSEFVEYAVSQSQSLINNKHLRTVVVNHAEEFMKAHATEFAAVGTLTILPPAQASTS